MSEVLELVLTAEMLRTAIRAQLRVGTSRQTISLLIRSYAPPGVRTERMDEGVYRVPVELIPVERRTAFLDALSGLPNRRPAVATSTAHPVG